MAHPIQDQLQTLKADCYETLVATVEGRGYESPSSVIAWCERWIGAGHFGITWGEPSPPVEQVVQGAIEAYDRGRAHTMVVDQKFLEFIRPVNDPAICARGCGQAIALDQRIYKPDFYDRVYHVLCESPVLTDDDERLRHAERAYVKAPLYVRMHPEIDFHQNPGLGAEKDDF